jgi:hypothetical protein
VIAPRPIGQEEDDRLARGQPCPDIFHRPADSFSLPLTLANGIDEHIVSDSTSAGVDMPRELLDVGVAIAPITKDHCRGGAATERGRLREVRNVEPYLLAGRARGWWIDPLTRRERQRNDEQWEGRCHDV